MLFTMRIDSLHVKNFRNFGDAVSDFDDRVT